MDRRNLLCRAEIDGQTYRYSDRFLKFAPPYRKHILALSAAGRDLSNVYGGMEKTGTTTVTFDPYFGPTFPPPVSFDCVVELGTGTADTGDRLYAATAHRKSLTESATKYQLYPPGIDEEFTKDQSFSTTLLGVFQQAATALGLTLVSTFARNPSPAVVHTMSRDTLIYSVLDLMCGFFSHHGYIDLAAGELHLVDMDTDTASRTVPRKYFSPELTQPAPVAKVKAKSGNSDYSQSSGYGYGKEISVQPFHTTQSNIEAALADILTLANHGRYQVTLPLGDGLPLPGEKIICHDHKFSPAQQLWCRARSFKIDLKKQAITIEGEGGMSKL